MSDKIFFENGVLKKKNGDIRQGLGAENCCCDDEEDLEECPIAICVSGTTSTIRDSHWFAALAGPHAPYPEMGQEL